MKQMMSRIAAALRTTAARRVLTGVLCAALLAGTALCALSLSVSVSAARSEQEQAETGGSEVLSYLPLAQLVRLSYTEPDLLLQLDASPSPEEIVIYVQDANGSAAVGIPFQILVTNEDGVTGTYVDEDCDGVIHCPSPDPGLYHIELVPVEGYATPEPIEVTVEKKVEHVKVDVSDQILTEDDVDVQTEDNLVNPKPTAPPPSSTDTVPWLESQKVLVSTEEVDKPVTDASGNPLYIAIPVVRDGYLVLADGTTSGLRATLAQDGTLAKAEKYVEAAPAPAPAPEPDSSGSPDGDPAVSGDEVSAGDPVSPGGSWVDCTAEVVDSFGKPVAGADGSPVYQFSSVNQKTEKVTEEVYSYRGWQTFDGKTYYYDQNGSPVTGAQIIQGKNYYFNEKGERTSSLGIDVSTWNAGIDWQAVKNSGVEFVIIRCGFRGYTEGGLIEDSRFRSNIAGAQAAGLKIGIYFFTQAINEREAVEEASMCLQMVGGYRITYPIFMDMEDAGSSVARANKLSNSQRTAIITAFCDTIRSSGYRAGLYANKSYLTSKINTSQLSSSYVIWLAHYTTATNYAGRFEMWQYSSTGSIPGVPGSVDLNISYLGY